MKNTLFMQDQTLRRFMARGAAQLLTLRHLTKKTFDPLRKAENRHKYITLWLGQP